MQRPGGGAVGRAEGSGGEALVRQHREKAACRGYCGVIQDLA